jgi:hypothetical protein
LQGENKLRSSVHSTEDDVMLQRKKSDSVNTVK